jgi:hypothetical protein
MKPSLVIDYEKLHIFNPYKSTAILLFFGSRPLPSNPLNAICSRDNLSSQGESREIWRLSHGAAAVTSWGVFLRDLFFLAKGKEGEKFCTAGVYSVYSLYWDGAIRMGI